MELQEGCGGGRRAGLEEQLGESDVRNAGWSFIPSPLLGNRVDPTRIPFPLQSQQRVSARARTLVCTSQRIPMP